MLSKPKEPNKKFAEVINEFIKRDRNNDIVVEVFDMDMGMGDILGTDKLKKENSDSKQPTDSLLPNNKTVLKKDAKENTDAIKKKLEKAKSCIATDYIVGGDTQIVITVEKATK